MLGFFRPFWPYDVGQLSNGKSGYVKITDNDDNQIMSLQIANVIHQEMTYSMKDHIFWSTNVVLIYSKNK